MFSPMRCRVARVAAIIGSPALRVFGPVSLMNLLAGRQCYRRGWGNPTKQLKRNKLHEEVDKALVIVRSGTNLAAEDPIRPRRISDDHRQQKKRADEEKRLRAGCGGRIPQTD
jgi:hypothetical protein